MRFLDQISQQRWMPALVLNTAGETPACAVVAGGLPIYQTNYGADGVANEHGLRHEWHASNAGHYNATTQTLFCFTGPGVQIQAKTGGGFYFDTVTRDFPVRVRCAITSGVAWLYTPGSYLYTLEAETTERTVSNARPRYHVLGGDGSHAWVVPIFPWAC